VDWSVDFAEERVKGVLELDDESEVADWKTHVTSFPACFKMTSFPPG